MRRPRFIELRDLIASVFLFGSFKLAAIGLYNLTSFASLMSMFPFEVGNGPALDNWDCGHLLLVIAFWFAVLVQA